MNGLITKIFLGLNVIGVLSYFWSEQTLKDDLFLVLGLIVTGFLVWQLKTYDHERLL